MLVSDPVEQYGGRARQAFVRLDAMEHTPDIAVISLYDPVFDEVAAFEELIGSHGGLGGPQTKPLILHPAEWEIDEELDRHQLGILRKGNVIVEGRLSGWLASQNQIPAVKILLQADIDIRAGRIVKREQGDIKKRKKEILKREKSEATRYKNYYGIDVADTLIYDVIIDSGDKTPEQIMQIILCYLGK